MANVKISELTALTPPDAADLVPVTDSSASQTKRTTVGEIVGIIAGDVDVANDGTATISELPVSKLQDGAARQLLQTDAAGTGVEWTDDVDLPGTLDVTGVTTLDAALNVAGLASLDGGIDVDGAFTVANATGNIVTTGTLGVSGQSTLASAAVSDLTSGRVVLAGASGEIQDSANLTFNGSELGVTGTLDVSSNATVGGDLTVVGDLTVEGATTILETQTVTVEDKNIEIGVVGTPTDTTADGGGITLKGATDKTINWVDATDAWTFSEHVELASGKEFYIDGNGVLNATTLGSGVVNSSLTSVGTIGTGTWEGDAIDAAYLDATVVTTSDTGTVTSTMISDGTIVNDDINASAAIAGTKIDPDFGSQTVETTGVINAGSGTEAAPAVTVGTTDNGLYSPGTDQVAISSNGSGRLFVDSSGDIGIGIASQNKNSWGKAVTLDTSTSGAYELSDSETLAAAFALQGDDRIELINFRSGPLTFKTDNTERLRITSDGKLLVGTSTAVTVGSYSDARIQSIQTNDATQAAFSALTYGSGGASYPRFLLGKANSTQASPSSVVDTQFVGSLEFFGYDGTNFIPAASIASRIDGTPGSNDMPGRLVFSVTPSGSASPTEALRISNDRSITVSNGGNVVLGTTTGTKIGTATNQKIGFYNATPVVQPTAVADITTTATSGSLPTPDGSVTIADAATPTVTELLEYCVELEAKLEAVLGHLRTLGLIAT